MGRYCGNGVIDPDGEGDVFQERCDDGPRNGTTESVCTKYCNGWTRGAPDFGYSHTYLGFRPNAIVGVLLDHPATGLVRKSLAFTSADYQGIVVAPEIRDVDILPLEDVTPTVRTTLLHIPTPAMPQSLGVVWLDGRVSVPTWVEAPRVGEDLQRMYYATVDRELQVQVHEVPYPFPDGTSATMHITPYDRDGVLIVDQSRNPPYDLLVAIVVIRSPTDVTTSTLRLPAPGRVRGAAVETTAFEERDQGRVQRLVQFFEDTGTFVGIVDRVPAGVHPSEATTYELSEFARGDWPYRVLSGVQWSEGCEPSKDLYATFSPVDFPEFSSPVPLAVLTDTGDVYTWRFSQGITGEPFLTPYARVMPGTQVIESYELFPTLFAWEPDGDFVAYSDSDCRDLRSTAVQPQRNQTVHPWTTMTRARTRTIFSGEFVVDDWLVLR